MYSSIRDVEWGGWCPISHIERRPVLKPGCAQRQTAGWLGGEGQRLKLGQPEAGRNRGPCPAAVRGEQLPLLASPGAWWVGPQCLETAAAGKLAKPILPSEQLPLPQRQQGRNGRRRVHQPAAGTRRETASPVRAEVFASPPGQLPAPKAPLTQKLTFANSSLRPGQRELHRLLAESARS